MGLSRFLHDLQVLADAKKARTAEMEAKRVRELHATFGEQCQWLVQIESSPIVDIIGSPLAIVPRLDGFAEPVVRLIPIVDNFLLRLTRVNSSTAADVLAEFGLPTLDLPDSARLARIVGAAQALADMSRSLVAVWPISGEEDREMQAAGVAEAARRLLADTGSN